MKKFIRSSSLAAVSFEQAVHSETHAPLEGAEGFGCYAIVANPYECHRHCQSIGYRGGCCNLRTVCTCCS